MTRSFRMRRSSRRDLDAVSSAGWLLIDDAQDRPVVEAPPPVTEQVRYIVERMRLHDADGLPGRIGVTSALAGEGAAMVARTLAGVLAGDADRTVCLVGLDWWSDTGAGDDEAGIAQVVESETEISFVRLPTSIPRLDYVPAGAAEHARLPELVRSTVLRSTLREIAMRYHHMVLELPPVRVTSESLALASHCDACMLVVRQGATSHNDVKAAIDSLGEERLLGVVMNEASSKVPRFLLRAVAPS